MWPFLRECHVNLCSSLCVNRINSRCSVVVMSKHSLLTLHCLTECRRVTVPPVTSFSCLQTSVKKSESFDREYYRRVSNTCDKYKTYYSNCFAKFLPKFLAGNDIDPCSEKLKLYVKYGLSWWRVVVRDRVRCLNDDLRRIGLRIDELDPRADVVLEDFVEKWCISCVFLHFLLSLNI